MRARRFERIRLAVSVLALAAGIPLPAAPLHLSETGLYKDIGTKETAAAVRTFSPQYPLWSDGAEKRRWVELPARKPIDAADWDHWEFPAGTKLWKELSFPASDGRPKRVETRLMEKVSRTRWEFTTYLWNEKETEANRAPAEGVADYYPMPGGAKHDIPSAAQCKTCHARGGDPVLGFEALQLSDDRDPMSEALGKTDLTNRKLVDLGWLENAPTDAKLLMPRVQAASAEGRAALGYLHANCGSCHNPSGSAVFSSLRFRHEGIPASETSAPGYATTVRSPTQYFKLSGEATTHQILPGHPEKSAVWVRMKAVASPVRMPMIATKRVDEEGAKRIAAWIKSLR